MTETAAQILNATRAFQSIAYVNQEAGCRMSTADPPDDDPAKAVAAPGLTMPAFASSSSAPPGRAACALQLLCVTTTMRRSAD